jgi:hypothetical protein
MATQAERAFFQQVDELLDMFARRALRVALAGPLNDEQVANVNFLLAFADAMRQLFKDEAQRQGCGAADE